MHHKPFGGKTSPEPAGFRDGAPEGERERREGKGREEGRNETRNCTVCKQIAAAATARQRTQTF